MLHRKHQLLALERTQRRVDLRRAFNAALVGGAKKLSKKHPSHGAYSKLLLKHYEKAPKKPSKKPDKKKVKKASKKKKVKKASKKKVKKVSKKKVKKVTKVQSKPKKATKRQTLVVCSCQSGNESKDYRHQKEAVEKVLGDLGNVTWLSVNCWDNKKSMGWYPKDVPKGKKYDVVWFAGCDHIPSSKLSAVATGGKVIFTSRASDAKKMYPSAIKNKHSVSLGERKGYLIQLESSVKRYKKLFDEGNRDVKRARIKYMKDKNDDNKEDYLRELDVFKRHEKNYHVQLKRAKEIKKNYRWHAHGYYYKKQI